MNSGAGHYEPIAREGHPFIIVPAICALLFWWYGHPWLSLLFVAVSLAIAMFFRNPERIAPQDSDAVLSPADGRVVQIEHNAQSRNMPNLSLQRISIFMSIFNVHVNRWPVSGTIRRITHEPGGFLDARDPAASITNENNSIVLDVVKGPIEVVQIAGKIARRIACWVQEGDEVRQGERLGLIRFGSRLDVYLPQGFTFTVEVGTKVRAGQTVIARREN